MTGEPAYGADDPVINEVAPQKIGQALTWMTIVVVILYATSGIWWQRGRTSEYRGRSGISSGVTNEDLAYLEAVTMIKSAQYSGEMKDAQSSKAWYRQYRQRQIQKKQQQSSRSSQEQTEGGDEGGGKPQQAQSTPVSSLSRGKKTRGGSSSLFPYVLTALLASVLVVAFRRGMLRVYI